MYKIESFEDGGALVVNTDASTPYRAMHNAATQAEAEQLVIEMNQPGMLTELAEYRLAFEIGGLELANGMRVSTDRQSQAQLNIAYTDLRDGFVPDTDWKAANNWETVTLEQIKPIAQAVAVHRRACFRGERVVVTAIEEASTLDLQLAIDISADFTAAYQAAVAEVTDAAQ